MKSSEYGFQKKKINSYVFDGYWEDIGTIKSFYDANIALCEPYPTFDFFGETQPIYTHMRNLPPSKINKAEINASILAIPAKMRNSICE